jgi:hypothetical protein
MRRSSIAVPALATLLVAAHASRAAADEPQIIGDRGAELAIALKGGQARFTGDVADADAKPASRGIQLRFRGEEADRESNVVKQYLGGFAVRTLVDFESTVAEQQGELEVVPHGEKIQVSATALDAEFCVLASFAVNVCPYIGYGQVELRDDQKDGDRYDVTYGTFPYGVNVPYTVRFDSWGLTAGYQFSGFSVQQTVAEKKRKLTYAASNLFFGVVF